MAENHANWFIEYLNPFHARMLGVNKYVFSGSTRFQKVDIIDTYPFGRCLMLDNKIQSSEFDEYVYHEALVHPPMILHANPESVLIIGGGEGAVLRETLGYPEVSSAIMIDIDEEVAELCKKYLIGWHQGSFNDSRVILKHMDARAYLEETENKFDVIISDLTEPVDAGPSYLLFTREFYRLVKTKLKPGGILVLQAGSFCPSCLTVHSALRNTLKTCFNTVSSYYTFISSFETTWGFIIASDGRDPLSLSQPEIDAFLAERSIKTRFYDGLIHKGLFIIPQNILEIFSKERRIIEDDHPLTI